MTRLIMANMNTLIRKGYLLAGVIMAANMFIVNEVSAMEEKEMNTNGSDTGGKQGKSGVQVFLNKVLSCENIINLIGGTVSSVANNYLKLWYYNQGWYRQFGWVGWRSKRFLNDISQFDINLNLGRGAFWLITGIIGFIQYANGKEDPMILLRSTAGLITMKILSTSEDWEKKNKVSFSFGVPYFIFFILQGFISIPLTFHLSKFNFSISISFDSIIWMGIGKILELKGEKKKEDGDQMIIENKNNEKK